MNDDKIFGGCLGIIIISFFLVIFLWFIGFRGVLGPREFAVRIERVTATTELQGSLVRSKFIIDPNKLGHQYKVISQGINRAAFVDHSTGADQTDLDVDQRIRISTGGVKFLVGVLIDYQLDPEKAINLIANYPVEHEDRFENEYLLNWVREAMSKSTANFTADDIYLYKKEEYRETAEQILREICDSLGIRIESLYFEGDPIPADPDIFEAYQNIRKQELASKAEEQKKVLQKVQNTIIVSQAEALKEASEKLKGIDPSTINALTRRYLAEKGINPFPAFQVAPGIGQ
jgi:hypothetical protein